MAQESWGGVAFAVRLDLFKVSIAPEVSFDTSALDSRDPNRPYVRVIGSGTVVLSSEDGGHTFHQVFAGAGSLPGFALSPDGAQMAVGGPNDGVWVGPAAGGPFERRSNVRPSCLAWNSDGLYACAAAAADGFSLGRSGG